MLQLALELLQTFELLVGVQLPVEHPEPEADDATLAGPAGEAVAQEGKSGMGGGDIGEDGGDRGEASSKKPSPTGRGTSLP